MGSIKLKPKAVKVVCNNCFRITTGFRDENGFVKYQCTRLAGLPQIPHHYIRRRFLAGFRELAWWQKSWCYPDLQLRQYEQEKRQKQERGTGHV